MLFFLGGNVKIKRTFDVVFSVVLLLLLSPIFLLISILILLTSSGPIIYSQARVGYQGSHFVIYKFRTLFHDPKRKHEERVHRGDTRITTAGKILRPTHLDELPQLWNILKGDMSFVGPRPMAIDEDKQISIKVLDFKRRYSVKPGLSGLAQVSVIFDKTHRSLISAFRYDCLYIKKCSLFLDLLILIKTIPVVFSSRGI